MMTLLNIRNIFIVIVTLAFLTFQMYIAFIKSLPPLIQNPIHLILALLIAFLWYPITKTSTNDKNNKKNRNYLFLVDIIIIVSLIFSAGYFFLNENRLVNRIQFLDPLTTLDFLVLFIILFTLLEAVRRVLGLNLLIFIGIFLIYAWFGPYFPSVISHSGIDLSQFTDLMIMGSDGIFGAPLNASVGFLYYFIIFGGFLAACGGGQVLIDLGMKIGNQTSGGPAKAAILSSSLLGMINGSAVANVTTTGVMTIPLMKQVGYKPEQAGAIEAVASTSGQVMPPIMGVGAFIMAEMTGIPYREIALAAIIPAVAYVVSLFILAGSIAKGNHFAQSALEKSIVIEPILRRLYLLIPVIIVVYNILQGSSLMYSALSGIGAVILINILRFKHGLGFKELFEVLLTGTKQVAQVAIPTAAAGIIIGIVVMSGLATEFAEIINNVGSLWIALIVTGMGCIILGMALPTVAAYLAAYILFVPALLELGIPALPANLFIFYFGVIAQITPPVALASFAAAGIADADAWKTGWTAFRYALVSFLVPFVFVYKPEILLLGTVSETVVATTIMLIGTFFLVAAVSGYLFRNLNIWERVILLITAIIIIIPEKTTSIVGLVIGLIFLIYSFSKSKKETGYAKTDEYSVEEGN